MKLPAFLTKRIEIEYINSESGIAPIGARNKQKYNAFFIEDKSSLKKRMNVKEIKGANDFVSKYADALNGKTDDSIYRFKNIMDNGLSIVEISKIEIMQNVIGNSDWYIKLNESDKRFKDSTSVENELWNIKVFESDKFGTFAIAQDFNLSTISMLDESNLKSGAINIFQKKYISLLSSDELKNLLIEVESIDTKFDQLVDETIRDVSLRDSMKLFLHRQINNLLSTLKQ